MRKRHLIAFLLQIIPIGLVAQHIFDNITVANGLSNNRVQTILQDREGFYWIATDDGLNRFDGSSFKIFRNEKNNPKSLIHNSCTGLLEDDNGDIWIATYNGISVFKKKDGSFYNISLSHPDIKPDILNRIAGIIKDEKGNIWIMAIGLWKYDVHSQKIHGFFHDVQEIKTLSDNSGVLYGSFDKLNNGIWVSTRKEINFFDVTTNQFFHKTNNPEHWKIFELQVSSKVLLDSNKLWFYHRNKHALCFFDAGANKIEESLLRNFDGGIRQLNSDHQRRIWICDFSRNAIVYDPITRTTDSNFFKNYHSKSILTSGFNDLGFDNENNFLFCTNKGISVFNYSHQYIKFHELNTSGSKSDNGSLYINCVAPASRQFVWVGSNQGLYKYDLNSRENKKITIPVFIKPIANLLLQNDSILWVSYGNDIYKFDCKRERIIARLGVGKLIQSITQDQHNNIWVGDWTDGLYKLNSDGTILEHYVHNDADKNSLPFNNLVCINYLDNGLWIGMNEGYGFAKYDLKTKKFDHFNPLIQDSTRHEYGTITDISSARKNIFLIGTHGGGVYLWDSKTNRYHLFQESDGLTGNFINSILPDRNGNYWISTSNGINFFNTIDQKISRIKIDFAFNANSYISNGKAIGDTCLFMFCNNKLLEIKPDQYSYSGIPAQILVSSFKVFDKDMSSLLQDSVIHLSFKQNFFSFEYSALKTNPDIDVQYLYKLEGFDENWNSPGTRRFASYTNVPGGKYTFKVKATNELGEWNDQFTSIVIIITPPFWKTWWFYIAVVALLLAIVYYFIRNRFEKLKERQQEQLQLVVSTQEAEKKNLASELHDDLGVRISALKYFVSSLQKYIQPKEKEADETYRKTIHTIDETMEEIRYLLINLSPKTLNEYGYLVAVEDLVNKLTRLQIIDISLLQTGMENRFSTEVESGLYRITQELINNTLKHAHANSIKLEVKRKENEIILDYTDDGKGYIPSQNGEGYGLQNIRTRISLLQGQIEWKTSEKNTSVNIRIPLNHTLG